MFSIPPILYRTDKATLNRNLSTAATLRSEVFALEKELTMQKVKCRALEEDLQNPLNIHRWRKLEVGLPVASLNNIVVIYEVPVCL